MASLEEIRDDRLRKLNLLKKKGINSFPVSVEQDFTIAEALADFTKLSKRKKPLALVGRIMAIRGHGGSVFFDIYDGSLNTVRDKSTSLTTGGSDKMQVYIKKDEVGEEPHQLFLDTIDIGDFIEVKGSLFVTKKKEKTLLVKEWKIISKSLRPLPDKWHGLQDVEERFRKRYLDILMNPEEKEIFIKKAKFWSVTRDFFNKKDFLEVETPTLEVTTGGAEARPFATHHNDFDMELFLRISVGELWQKRLMAAGFTKTFEIGRIFRNEGTSPEHLQEFTNLEFYWAYADYGNGMELVTELYREIARKVFGTTKFKARRHKFDLANKWKKIDYTKEVLNKTGIDVLNATNDEMKNKLEELGVRYDGGNRERLIDALWKYCRKQVSGPAFLINHPKIVAPLAKSTNDNSELVERFQVILAGSEIGNGYSELNDPIDQKERFKKQQRLIKLGDKEAMMPDWEFVEMLEYGMPPTCGFGFGERLFSVLIDRPIRETQLFPLMRPKNSKEEENND
jgi:lysyl-tRNA synthetase class 2